MHIHNSCLIRQKYYLKGEIFKINLKYFGHKSQQLGLVANNRINKISFHLCPHWHRDTIVFRIPQTP